jgi:hypothetical protein
MLKDGLLNACGCRSTTTRAGANSNEGLITHRNPENFIVVSDAIPSVTALRRLILPSAMG